MKPPSWDTSVFVPGSSRIAALIMLESASELAAEGANTAIMPDAHFGMAALPNRLRLLTNLLQGVATLSQDAQVILIEKRPITLLPLFSLHKNPQSNEILNKIASGGSSNIKLFCDKRHINDGIALKKLQKTLAI